MKSFIFFISLSLCLFACQNASKSGDNNNSSVSASSEGISPEQINNPATADNPSAKSNVFAEISFKDTFHDFGDILEHQKVEYTYEFTNSGKNDLLITNCQAACGCTVPNWPKEPIKPGKGGKIKVIFDSSGKGGVNNKMVTVYANIKEQTKVLHFRANVRAVPQQ